MKIHKLSLFCFLGFLTACSMGGKVVSQERYSEIYLGTSEAMLKDKLGQPHDERIIDSHEKVLEYVENVRAQNRMIEQRRYIFVIRDGQVASKKMKYDTTDVFDNRDAYDLQTSQNEPLVKQDSKQ